MLALRNAVTGFHEQPQLLRERRDMREEAQAAVRAVEEATNLPVLAAEHDG
jgi:hypothetical protein